MSRPIKGASIVAPSNERLVVGAVVQQIGTGLDSAAAEDLLESTRFVGVHLI